MLHDATTNTFSMKIMVIISLVSFYLVLILGEEESFCTIYFDELY